MIAREYIVTAQMGNQVSNTDYLICAIALRLDLPVFSTDRDFPRYENGLNVRLHDATQ